MDKNILRIKRLNKEEASLDKEPLENAFVKRKDDLKFYFCLYRLEDDYTNGFYFGLLELHPQYPFYAPKLFVYTPNGRYEQNLAICTSFTSYHQESWTSAWNVRSLIQATISFMYANEPSYGCRADPPQIKKKYARDSLSWNLQNHLFKQIFGQTIKAKLADIVKIGIHISDKQMILQLRKLGLEEVNKKNFKQAAQISSNSEANPPSISIKQQIPVAEVGHPFVWNQPQLREAPLIKDKPNEDIVKELHEIQILNDVDIEQQNLRFLRQQELRRKREKRKKIVKYIGYFVIISAVGVFAYYSLTKTGTSQTATTQSVNNSQRSWDFYKSLISIPKNFKNIITSFRSNQNQKIIVSDN